MLMVFGISVIISNSCIFTKPLIRNEFSLPMAPIEINKLWTGNCDTLNFQFRQFETRLSIVIVDATAVQIVKFVVSAADGIMRQMQTNQLSFCRQSRCMPPGKMWQHTVVCPNSTLKCGAECPSFNLETHLFNSIKRKLNVSRG